MALQCCGQTFPNEAAFAAHKTQAHGAPAPPTYACCGQTFPSAAALDAHKAKAHGMSRQPSVR